jgi:alginate O-acetyltransferase complex protein AlgI
MLGLTVAANLGLLAVFKYANFLISSANYLLSLSAAKELPTVSIALPIGISFFTFTQIAFLVDCYAGKVVERNPVHYLLFVSYFPHLVAGPVLHHSQMMPQFAQPDTYRPDTRKIAIGLALLTLGLAKKLLIADPLGQYADLVFTATQNGATPMFCLAWFGILAYAFQIYFDFSGYSDMAVGISLCFGILLPINFNSPYQAVSIIDFWRRWHISLSTFLRDYLYIGLGGNRRGPVRRYINLFTTMLLGGLWHGASWTFVLWGGIHGSLLAANHLWLGIRPYRAPRPAGRFGVFVARTLTFILICFAWVPFRADSMATVSAFLKGMVGASGFALPGSVAHRLPKAVGSWVQDIGLWQGLEMKTDQSAVAFLTLVLAAGFICWCFRPATNLVRLLDEPQPQWPSYRNLVITAILLGILFSTCVAAIGKVSPFLYFQF